MRIICFSKQNKAFFRLYIVFFKNNLKTFFTFARFGKNSIILSVFDRWSVQVVKSHDDVIGWDGKNGGKLCEQGVYVYQVEVVTMGGKEFVRTGHVTLLSKIK